MMSAISVYERSSWRWDCSIVVKNALGTHTTVSRVQGSKLKAKREIRVATLFKTVPDEFLRMITVHELAHLKERDHDKAFYQLCTHMEPRYHQLEFEVRVYLTHLEVSGARLWGASGPEMVCDPDAMASHDAGRWSLGIGVEAL